MIRYVLCCAVLCCAVCVWYGVLPMLCCVVLCCVVLQVENSRYTHSTEEYLGKYDSVTVAMMTTTTTTAQAERTYIQYIRPLLTAQAICHLQARRRALPR